MLAAESSELRLEAARHLIEQGRSDERAFEVLISVLRDEDLLLRTRAAHLLIEHGRGDERVFETLVSVLEAGDPHVVELSISMLGPSGPVFKVVVAMFEAARLLIEHGRGDERVFEALASILGAEDPTLRFEAARLLIEYGRGDERVFEALVTLLGVEKDLGALLQFPVAQLLIEHGRGGWRVFEELVRASNELPKPFRGANILVKLKRADNKPLEMLDSLLGAEDLKVRIGAAQLLIEHGRGDERVFEALVSALGAENPRLRFVAARLLIEEERGDERVFKALDSLLGADPPLRFRAAQLLIEHGRGDEGAFEVLISMLLKKEVRWVGLEWARLFIEQGHGVERLAEALVTVLGDEHPGLLTQTLKRVSGREQLSPEDGEYLAALVSLHEDDDDVRRAARSTLFGFVFECTDTAQTVDLQV